MIGPGSDKNGPWQIHLSVLETNPPENTVPAPWDLAIQWNPIQKWQRAGKKHPAAGQGSTRSQNSRQIEFSSRNGREISSSVYGRTRPTQLYISNIWNIYASLGLDNSWMIFLLSCLGMTRHFFIPPPANAIKMILSSKINLDSWISCWYMNMN